MISQPKASLEKNFSLAQIEKFLDLKRLQLLRIFCGGKKRFLCRIFGKNCTQVPLKRGKNTFNRKRRQNEKVSKNTKKDLPLCSYDFVLF